VTMGSKGISKADLAAFNAARLIKDAAAEDG
jgi:hypothetical protein